MAGALFLFLYRLGRVSQMAAMGYQNDILTETICNILGQDGGTANKPHFKAVPVEKQAAANNAEQIQCQCCGTMNMLGSVYCNACGSHINFRPKRQFEEIPKEAVKIDVRLVSINEDSTDGERIPLLTTETIIGREGDERFPVDPFLSPKHARLIVDNRKLYIEDLDSLNGTFLRVRGDIALKPGDCFLAGRQLLRFEKFDQISPKSRSLDGTRFLGSPSNGGEYKLVQIGVGHVNQNVYCLAENGAVFGREVGDIVFNKDRFMSGRHAQIFLGEDGKYYLLDLNSSNGTWIKLTRKSRLYPGDLIFLGQQLFRIDSRDLV